MTAYHADFYRDLLDNLYDGVYYVDPDRRITFWNKAAHAITGYSPQEVMGRRCADNLLRHVDDTGVCLCLHSCPLAETIKDGRPRSAAVYLHHKDGHRLPVAVRVTPLRSPSGEILGAVEIFSDNSEKVAALQRLGELENLAYLDTLTGIANRKYLEIFLDARFNEFERYAWPFGMVFADIDNFKAVNDAHGHLAGDQVLRMVAHTLAQNCRSFDLVGRWGGDEFLCVLGHLKDLERLRFTAERFRRLVAESAVVVDGSPLTVTLSLGATLVLPGDTVESVTSRIDHLLYQSKATGRNCLHIG